MAVFGKGVMMKIQSHGLGMRGKSLLFVIATGLIIALLLATRFYAMLFFPGTPETRPLFNFLTPIWSELASVVMALAVPLTLLADSLMPLLPPQAHAWFPEAPAAEVMGGLTNQPPASLADAYPGSVEWLTLLAIPFWSLLLLGLHYSFFTLSFTLKESELSVGQILRRTELARFLPNKQKKPPSADMAFPRKTNPEAPSRTTNQAAHADQLRKRLKDTGNIAAPDIRRPVSSQEKTIIMPGQDKLGEVAYQQILRDLQRENMELQTRQQQLRSTFSQYFSPSMLKYMEENRAAFENIQNRRHRVSVLFCDVRNYAAFAQQASPEELTAFLQEYFDIVINTVLNRHDGVINKLMGDGVMAYFGFPIPTDDHPLTATQAGLDILHEVNFRNQTNPQAQPLEMGIGVATGEVIIGNIGSQDYKDFTLLGTTVNLASRLDDLNKDLDTSFLIDRATFEAVQGQIPCQDMGTHTIKGWEGPLPVYRPIPPPTG